MFGRYMPFALVLAAACGLTIDTIRARRATAAGIHDGRK